MAVEDAGPYEVNPSVIFLRKCHLPLHRGGYRCGGVRAVEDAGPYEIAARGDVILPLAK